MEFGNRTQQLAAMAERRNCSRLLARSRALRVRPSPENLPRRSALRDEGDARLPALARQVLQVLAALPALATDLVDSRSAAGPSAEMLRSIFNGVLATPIGYDLLARSCCD
jgi:hypothetical protein